MNPLTERAVGLLGLSTPATRAIRATFDRMEVAEAAIRQMKVPDNGRAVFGALVPMMEAMTKVALWVYRAHAVELCGRYMDGGEAKLATKDEIMLALHESSLKAPLNDQGMACYAATFLYCAHVSRNRRAIDFTIEQRMQDMMHLAPWGDAIEEGISGLRTKLSRPERRWRS